MIFFFWQTISLDSQTPSQEERLEDKEAIHAKGFTKQTG